MTSDLTLPTVLSELSRRAALTQSTATDLYQVVRAMQRLGLPLVDIEVHIERARATNDATTKSPIVEANCLVALEIATGEAARLALDWDHAELATIYVPRVVTEQSAMENLAHALTPSDLLPPRPGRGDLTSAVHEIPGLLMEQFHTESWRPSVADEFRVPKSAFTSRPGALLVLSDRVALETLAAHIEVDLDLALPDSVLWPRKRDSHPNGSLFKDIPKSWDAEYIVKVDIAGFYEAVDHSLLAMILSSRLGAHSDVSQAAEHLLGAVMGRSKGLPQGPLASDIFASAYLILIDDHMTSKGWRYARLADDYFVAADSMADGRQKLELIERLLAEHSLRLNERKTSIIRGETYSAMLNAPPPGLAKIKSEIRARSEQQLVASQDQDEIVELLNAAGADEQLLFDVVYHGTVTIEEAIVQLGEGLDPDAVTIRLKYLRDLDRKLAAGELSDDMNGASAIVRDCIAIMAAAKSSQAINLTERLLWWFPAVAEYASVYFEVTSLSEQAAVDTALTRLLRPFELSDWAAAWLCRSIEKRTSRVSDDLLELLKLIVASPLSGPLTRANAVWALASKGSLTSKDWFTATENASDAIKAELDLAQRSTPERYPPPNGVSDRPSIGSAP